ncbi:MAG: hypothetical protein ACO3JL_20710 [Myxococcota bacterium]
MTSGSASLLGRTKAVGDERNRRNHGNQALDGVPIIAVTERFVADDGGDWVLLMQAHK